MKQLNTLLNFMKRISWHQISDWLINIFYFLLWIIVKLPDNPQASTLVNKYLHGFPG